MKKYVLQPFTAHSSETLSRKASKAVTRAFGESPSSSQSDSDGGQPSTSTKSNRSRGKGKKTAQKQRRKRKPPVTMSSSEDEDSSSHEDRKHKISGKKKQQEIQTLVDELEREVQTPAKKSKK